MDSEAWTYEQDEIIIQLSNRAPHEIAYCMRKAGYNRTEKDVEARAAFLGLSLAVYEICPNCGGRVPELKYSAAAGGYMCDLCATKALIKRQRSLLSVEEEQRETAEEQRRAKKEYDAIRQARLRQDRREAPKGHQRGEKGKTE